MPYASDRQRRYMHARHPEIAARWDAEMMDSPAHRALMMLRRESMRRQRGAGPPLSEEERQLLPEEGRSNAVHPSNEMEAAESEIDRRRARRNR